VKDWFAGVDYPATLAFLDKGGPVVAVIAVMSVLALAVALLKAAQFVATGVGRPGRVRGAVDRWVAGDRDAAMRRLTRVGQPSSAAVLRAMQRLAAGDQSAVAREDAVQVAESRLGDLRAHLRVLEATAQVAPLLGLFGTVLGMMGAFQTLEAAGGEADPAALAGGIWVALITTATGLAVAIPAGLALYWFEGCIERETVLAETSLARVFADCPAEARGGMAGGAEPPGVDANDPRGAWHAAH
jgi:biopolymer transport protein ExbB